MSLPLETPVLERYLANDCSGDELAVVQQTLAAHPTLAKEVSVLRQVIDEYGLPAAVPTPQQAWATFTTRQVQSVARRHSPPRLPRGRWALGAAVLCGAIAMMVVGRRMPSPSDSSATRQYATRAGEQREIKIDDGATAVLGPATELSVVRRDGQTDVHVSGKVVFSVVHRPASTFVVHVGQSSVQVLGTTFAVRQYPEETHARIAVANGKVAVSSARSRAVLGRGALGVVDDSGAVHVVSDGAADDGSANDELAWSHGTLVFRNAPVTRIVAELSRAYAADIKLGDSILARRTLTLSVPVTAQSLNDVLAVIAVTLDAHVTHVGHTITIGAGTHSSPKRIVRPSLTPETQYGR